jgi:quercetin dioxygenase-like cupin family protein
MTNVHQQDEKSGRMPPAKALELRELVAYQPGAIVSRTLVDKESGTVSLFAFDAGQKLSEHTAPFDAMVTILDGESELIIGKKSVPARAGQSVLMPAKIPHALNAITQFKMLLVMIRET